MLILLLATVGAASATTVLSTGAPSGSICCYGYPDTSTYGQTFVAPAQSRLDQFTFAITESYNIPTQMGAYVGTWTGTNLGTLDFSSAALTVSSSGTVVVNTGGLALTPGATYVAFLSVSNYYTGGDYYEWPGAADGGNTGGTFVFSNNGGNFSQLYGNNWFAGGWTPADTQFTATFNPAVPEPGTLVMFGSGIVGLAGILRRKINL